MTSFSSITHFRCESQIEYFSCKGKIFVCGDLNAELVVEKEEELHLPTPQDDVFETI